MGYLCRWISRGVILVLATFGACSCSIPAYRDFAEVSTTSMSAQGSDSDSSATQPSGVSSLPVVLQPDPVAPEDLSPILTPIGKQNDIPGFAALVLRGDRVMAEGVAGVRRIGTDVPVRIDDQFHIASGAKAMSAMLVARLVEEGVLEWDRPLTRYFPDERLHADWGKVTLRRLLTHTAGLKDPLVTFLRSTAFDRGTLMERRSAFVRRVLRSKPALPPGVQFAYNNADYIVTGAVVEKVTGKAWEQLMHTYVFAPLGLESAGFGPPGVENQTLQPWGHGRFRLLQLGIFGNNAFDPAGRGADYPAIASPAGYIHLSIRDWAKFVSLHLRAHPANPNTRLVHLRRDTVSMLQGIGSELPYAGGWNVDTRPWAKGARATDTGRVLYHIGDNGRWTSAVWLAPEKDLAILVACNRGNGSRAVDEVAARLVSHYARR